MEELGNPGHCQHMVDFRGLSLMGRGAEDLSQDSSEHAKLSLDLHCKEAFQKGKDSSITRVPCYPPLGSVRPGSECLFILTVMENSTNLTPQARGQCPQCTCAPPPRQPSPFSPWPTLLLSYVLKEWLCSLQWPQAYRSSLAPAIPVLGLQAHATTLSPKRPPVFLRVANWSA